MGRFFKRIWALKKQVRLWPFSSWKVFYQVLTVILVMVVFLAVQGFLGIKMIGDMREATTAMVTNSSNHLDELDTVSIALEQTRSSYLDVLSGHQKNSFVKMAYDIENRLNDLKAVDSKMVAGMVQAVQEMRQLISKPVNNANFDTFDVAYQKFHFKADQLRMRVTTAGTQIDWANEAYSNHSKMLTLIFLIASAVISVLLGLFISISLSRSLKKMEGAAKAIAVGDLSRKADVVGCPEIRRVALALNQGIDGLQNLIRNVDNHTEILSEASGDLKNVSAQTGRSAMEVARAMEELARGATEQTNLINSAVNLNEILSRTVQKVSTATQQIFTSSETVIVSAQEGQKATRDVTNEINGLYSLIREVAIVIHELSERANQISEITAMINGIAEQTTLLALNASIEAARAGEHGKGFGVVAMETGKLAEQSKQATHSIADLLYLMVNKTTQAVAVTEKGIHQAETTKQYVERASQTFDRIFGSLMENMGQIKEVAEAAQMMARNNEQTCNAVSSLAAYSEETLASTEQVSANAQEQTASVEEVTALSENLSKVAIDLKQSVAAFTL